MAHLTPQAAEIELLLGTVTHAQQRGELAQRKGGTDDNDDHGEPEGCVDTRKAPPKVVAVDEATIRIVKLAVVVDWDVVDQKERHHQSRVSKTDPYEESVDDGRSCLPLARTARARRGGGLHVLDEEASDENGHARRPQEGR